MIVFEFEHLQVEVDKAESLITIKPLRVLTVDEINDFRRGFLMESGCRLILWDLRESDLTDMTGDDAMRFSAGNTDGPPAPVSAFLKVGTDKHFFINIILTLIGFVPGVIHALWLIFRD